MTTKMSELASYHPSNPDPIGVAGCLNTGNAEDGVVFPGVEVLEATACYIGRTSIIEAMALLFDTTPRRVKDLMTGDKATADEVRKLTKELVKANGTINKAQELTTLLDEALHS